MRTISRLILSAVFLVLTAALAAVANYMPELFFSFYTDFSKDTLAFLAGITGPFPFAVWQVGLVLIVLLALYFLVRNLAQKRGFFSWLAGIVLLVSMLVFLFVGLWGLNHFGPALSDRVGLQVTGYTKDQLIDTAEYMAAQANNWAGQVERNENGDLAIDFDAWSKEAPKGYQALAKTNPFFDGCTAPVKRLLVDDIFSYMGITGIFVPFTGESGVNLGAYNAAIPFTMCHELAHRLTVAAEDEANFAAFLACKEMESPDFQYSGWYSAFVYTYNALHRVDREAAAQVWEQLSERVKQDCRNATSHYDQYEGQVQEAATKVNDVYLKVFKEESGVRSYGEVADLLIAWYLKESNR